MKKQKLRVFGMIKGSVLCISVLLLTACATQEVTPSQPNSVTVEDEVKALKQTRSQLQFQFANLAAIWWQRQGELVDTSSNLPLNTSHPETLKAINQALEQKVNQLERQIATLDEKVIARKKGQLEGLQVTLTLKYGGFKAAKAEKSQAVHASQITLVQGETTRWALQTKKGELLPIIKVTLSETNHLFMDEQLISRLEIEREPPSFITSVNLYGGQINTKGQLDMMLDTELTSTQ